MKLHTDIPKPNRLRWEISLALLLKVMLLTGLWFLIFRWNPKPDQPADIARQLMFEPSNISSPIQPPKESNHDR